MAKVQKVFVSLPSKSKIMQINIDRTHWYDRIWAALIFFTRLPFWRLHQPPKECYATVVEHWPLAGWITGGAMAEPAKGSSHRSHFYREKFAKGPRWDEVEALVEIYGYHHNGIDYNEPGQVIDQIRINGLDESLGLGTRLIIPMQQGKYKGGNELIKDVRIKSYTFSSYSEGHQNKDADINIVITSTTGDIITISFADDITPYDGYY